MGTDPETDDYEAGDACTLCVDLLFDGTTPKYVEVDVSGIVKCGIAPNDPPNGTWLLTQAEEPCVWRLTSGVFSFMWKLGANRSQLSIWQGMFVWFIADIVNECIDAFVNELSGCLVGQYGEDGYALCYWGPTIGP